MVASVVYEIHISTKKLTKKVVGNSNAVTISKNRIQSTVKVPTERTEETPIVTGIAQGALISLLIFLILRQDTLYKTYAN